MANLRIRGSAVKTQQEAELAVGHGGKPVIYWSSTHIQDSLWFTQQKSAKHSPWVVITLTSCQWIGVISDSTVRWCHWENQPKFVTLLSGIRGSSNPKNTKNLCPPVSPNMAEINHLVPHRVPARNLHWVQRIPLPWLPESIQPLLLSFVVKPPVANYNNSLTLNRAHILRNRPSPSGPESCTLTANGQRE